MSVKCFYLEPTGRQKVGLRRYQSSDRARCPLPQGYHDAIVWIGEEVENKRQGSTDPLAEQRYLDDPRWPAQCACGHPFDALDNFQVFTQTLYRRTDDPAVEMLLRDAPPGAMWDAPWQGEWRKGPDGRSLHVKCPDGTEWCIDGRASNCDSPCANCGRPYHAHSADATPCAAGFKDAVPHKCWVRTGTPPQLTVGKNGVTCGAGAGSIITPGGHWFLRNGAFENC